MNCLNTCTTPEQVLTTVDPSLTTDVTSKCYAIPKLAGCEEYYQKTTLTVNDFETLYCKTCQNDYYRNPLNHFECLQRKGNYDNCVTRNPTEDKCTACGEGFYLSPNKDKCIAYPTGFYGCVAYDSATNCIMCDDYHYMDASKNCILVENYSTKVSNCRIFKNAEECLTCAPNYFLTEPK